MSQLPALSCWLTAIFDLPLRLQAPSSSMIRRPARYKSGSPSGGCAKAKSRLQAAIDLVGWSLSIWDPLTGALCWDANTKAMWDLPPDAHADHAVFLAGIRPEDRPHVDAAMARTIEPAGDGLYEV
jgi:hypothetical protein